MNNLLLEHFDELISTPEDVEKLNRSILQMAMQGRLTHQDSLDEPAIEILKRISEQKQKSVHPVKESEVPFELPEGWVWTKLQDVSRLITDGTHVTPKYQYDGVPFLSVKDVSKGYLDFSSTRFISEEEHKTLTARCKPEFGDILLTKVGTTGIALVVDTDREFSIFVSIALLKGFQNEVLPSYLSMLINSPFVKEQSDKYTMGVGNKNLVLKYIRDFLIPLPPLAEQHRIVARVEELFAQTRRLAEELSHSRTELDRLNESALAHLLASETQDEFNERWGFIAEHFDLLTSAPEHIAPLRQSILELAVRGKLTRREAGDESAGELLKRIKDEKEKLGKTETLLPINDSDKPFELPNGWEWIRLEHLLPEYQNGLGRRTSASSGRERIILRLADLGSGTITTDNSRSFIMPEEEIAKYDLREGDMLITRVNGSIDLIGSFTLVTEGDLYSYCDHFIRMRLIIANVLPLYLSLASKSKFVRNQIQEKFITTAGQKTVNQRHISSLFFPLPPLAEQERIVKRVEQLLGWCDALEAQLMSTEGERGRLVESVLAGVGGQYGE